MAIKRTSRVHIQSADGTQVNAQITDEHGQELPFRVAEITYHMQACQPAMATLVCYLPSLDVLTKAELEMHSMQMHAASVQLIKAAEALEAHGSIETARGIRGWVKTHGYLTGNEE